MFCLEILKCNITSQFVIDIFCSADFQCDFSKKLPRDMAITARSGNHTLSIFEVWGDKLMNLLADFGSDALITRNGDVRSMYLAPSLLMASSDEV